MRLDILSPMGREASRLIGVTTVPTLLVFTGGREVYRSAVTLDPEAALVSLRGPADGP